ncbi:CBD9-like protein [Thozetella sp. PMI_491]|nr:CBD9-like protein [Thozetella sp. PMI_491]
MNSSFLWTVALLLAANFVKADSPKPAVSNLYFSNLQSSFAINLPPNSDDVNFYLVAPTWYSYFAVGIGSTMAGSLMLVAYSAADNQHVTVSPRLGTGDTEPPYYPGVTVSLSSSSSIQNDSFVVFGTCKGCRAWRGGSLATDSATQPFIFAVGPNLAFASDDLSAGLRRHIGYGHFTMNTTQASGPDASNLFATAAFDNTVITGATASGGIHDDADRKALAHGVLMALATLVAAPLDTLVANALRRWIVAHILTSTLLFILVIAGFGTGISLSPEYIWSQSFRSPHQVLGFVAFALLMLLLVLGVGGQVGKVAAGRQEQQQEQQKPRWHERGFRVHAWIGRVLWLILLVNCGVGLKTAAASTTFIIGYAVLAAGACIATAMILGCLYLCFRKDRKSKDQEEDAAHQLASIYDH